MEHCGYVVVIKELKKHPNADRLQIATFFGNNVCVGLDAAIGEIGIYFPSDLQLSEEYCRENDLVRRKDENGNAAGGYLDPVKRNIRPIVLRGERSDGLFAHLSSLTYTGVNMDDLNVGDTVSVVNGHHICNKYIPLTHAKAPSTAKSKTRRKKVNAAPLFVEHADTEQLAYHLADFRTGDEVEITLKMHGTSQRTGHLPVLNGYADTWPCRVGNAYRHIMRKLGCYHGEDVHDGKPIYDYGYVSGTRRTVLDDYSGGFYGDNAFREKHAKLFEGKLHRNETVYYEVVGFLDNGNPIMNNGDNKKLNDKEFIKQYGEVTCFSYGCSSTGFKEVPMSETGLPYGAQICVPKSDIYVYRMTMTNDDGFVVEYTPDFMRYRCEQMGVKTVPVLAHFIIPEYSLLPDDVGSPQPVNAGEYVRKIAEQFCDGADPIGKTHIREGVVVRIINRPKFTAYKCKSWFFKMLEGLIKETADAPDMEEAQSLVEEGEN